MNISKTVEDIVGANFMLINVLLKHFAYSIKDINSYEELTSEEKDIISKDTFDFITKKE